MGRAFDRGEYSAPYEALAFNNLIINGGMEVDQEHSGGAVTVAGGYVLDGWLVQKTGTMVCTAQQVADAPAGFTNSLKVTVGTAEAALAAGDFAVVVQTLEGIRTSRLSYGTANAVTSTLVFFTKIHRTGTYSGCIRNPAGNRSYPFTFTQNVADTWELKSVTIPGDIAGTWVGNTNAAAVNVFFAIAAGTTFAGTANTWAASNFLGATGTTNGVAATTDVFQITGVSLLPGTVSVTAASAPLLKRSYDQELLLCKRYFETGAEPLLYATYAAGLTAAYGEVMFQVAKRTGPTMTATGWQYYNAGANTAFTPVLSATTTRFTFQGSGLTNWQGWTASGTWTADARL